MFPYLNWPIYSGWVWNTPVVPNMYWNVYSAEQRWKNMSLNIGKMSAYLDNIAEETNEWGEEFVNEVNEQIEYVIREAEKYNSINRAQKNFRCKDRFIAGEWYNNTVMNSAQSGCVFKQDNVNYWVQYIKYTTVADSMFIVRDIDNNRTISETNLNLGHGYSMSYNANLKKIVTENHDNRTMVIIDMSDIYNPEIESVTPIATTNCGNPVWYDDEHVLMWYNEGSSTTFYIYDLELNFVDEKTIDLQGAYYGHGFVSQTIDYYAPENTLYISTTNPNGVIVVDFEIGTMVDFITTEAYYSYIYMNELEFSSRNNDCIYINNYERIDGYMVVSLFEHNLVEGTIPDRNCWGYDTNMNYVVEVDFDNGSLIPSENTTMKLLGDAYKIPRILGEENHGITINLKSDYPHITTINGVKVRLESPTAVEIEGITVANRGEILCVNASRWTVKPSQAYAIGGTTYNAGILVTTGGIVTTFLKNSIPALSSVGTTENAVQIAGALGTLNMYYIVNNVSTAIQCSTINARSASYFSKYSNCVMNIVESSS